MVDKDVKFNTEEGPIIGTVISEDEYGILKIRVIGEGVWETSKYRVTEVK
ncbi:hypothetical protein [Paenibacillus sp. FSL H3-0286]